MRRALSARILFESKNVLSCVLAASPASADHSNIVASLQRCGYPTKLLAQGSTTASVDESVAALNSPLAQTALLFSCAHPSSAELSLLEHGKRIGMPVVHVLNADSSANSSTSAGGVAVVHGDLSSAVCDIAGHKRAMDPAYRGFGPHSIYAAPAPGLSQVFYETPYSIALVNIKPVLPGHVLIISRRPCPRFTQLTPVEVSDLWATAQRVGAALEAHLKGASLTLAIQDGPYAGQSVPHVHIHVLVRHPADLQDNDEIYDMIDNSGLREGDSDHLHGGSAQATGVSSSSRPTSGGGGGGRGGVVLDPLRGAAGPGAATQAVADAALAASEAAAATASATASAASAAVVPPSPVPGLGTDAAAATPVARQLVRGQSIGDLANTATKPDGKPDGRPAAHKFTPRAGLRSLEDMAAEAAEYRALLSAPATAATATTAPGV